MSYSGSATCSAKRVHICQYCGTIFSYPIRKKIATSEQESRSSAVKSLQSQAEDFLNYEVKMHVCPHCGLLQTSMIYKKISWNVPIKFILAIVLLGVTYWYLLSDLGFFARQIACWAVSVLFLAGTVWDLCLIRRFFNKRDEKKMQEQELPSDSISEYCIQRRYFQHLQLFLILSAVSYVIPIIGLCIGGCSLLAYYAMIMFLPKRFRNQGFPLYYHDVNIR